MTAIVGRWMRPWRVLLLVGLPLAVGLTASVIALDERHDGDLFTANQRYLQPYDQRRAVEQLVATAPAPTAAAANGHPRAGCSPGSQGVLQNPWRCRLRYPSGLTLHYTVTIRANGSYFGQGPTDKKDYVNTIHGCCLRAS